MTLLALGMAGWLGAVGFLCCMGRAAAIGDAELRAVETRAVSGDRRTGPPDRRSAARPWRTPSPGRREEDFERREQEDARRRSAEAEEDDFLLEALGY